MVGQLMGLVRVLGVLLHGGGDLFHRGGSLFQRTGLASVRSDKSRLPLAISVAATVMAPVPLRTSETMPARLSFISFNECSSCAVSSLPRMTTSERRSPAATVRAICTASPSGRTMLRTRVQVMASPAAATGRSRPAAANAPAGSRKDCQH
jgi:hypothetical protein